MTASTICFSEAYLNRNYYTISWLEEKFFANHKHLVVLSTDSDLQLCSMSLGYECSAAVKSSVPSAFCRNVLKRLLMSSINPKDFLLFFSVCWTTFQFYYPYFMSEQVWTQKCWWRAPHRSQTDQMLAASCHSLPSMPVIGCDPKQNRVNWALYQPCIFLYSKISLHIYVLSRKRCISMTLNIFTVFLSSLYLFSYYQALVRKHIFPHQPPSGFVSFSSACKKMFFNFLLEQHASSTADILARVSLFPCQMCYFSHSPSCCLWVPHSTPSLHTSALPCSGDGTGVWRDVTPLAHCSSAAMSVWDCISHPLQAELEHVILPCWVLSGLTPGMAPLFACMLAACNWFSPCLVTAGENLQMFAVCTGLWRWLWGCSSCSPPCCYFSTLAQDLVPGCLVDWEHFLPESAASSLANEPPTSQGTYGSENK